MPHAEQDADAMAQPMTNGEVPRSQFLSHIASYPVVQEASQKYKENPYGAKTIEIANGAYSRFGAPFLPYLATPYSYFAPYVSKADQLADNGLGKVDGKFPIVREDSAKIWDTTLSYALYPVKVANTGKQYIFDTYADESKKTEGKGLTHTVKAVISTDLKVLADVAQWVADYLGPKKEEAKKTVQAKKNEAKEKMNG